MTSIRLMSFIAAGAAMPLVAQAPPRLTIGASTITSGDTATSTSSTASSVVRVSAATRHPPGSGGPKVGDVAPDFTFVGATRYGLLREPTKLSDLRGQTVVLAFFPGARTPGCTIQMEKYRDGYGTLFQNGAHVVVIGMSVDDDTALASWAHDAHFPMLFASDAQKGAFGAVGTAYGAYDTTYKLEHRLLYVIGPDGKVVYVAKPFDVSKPESYSDLAEAVKKTLPTVPER